MSTATSVLDFGSNRDDVFFFFLAQFFFSYRFIVETDRRVSFQAFILRPTSPPSTGWTNCFVGEPGLFVGANSSPIMFCWRCGSAAVGEMGCASLFVTHAWASSHHSICLSPPPFRVDSSSSLVLFFFKAAVQRFYGKLKVFTTHVLYDLQHVHGSSRRSCTMSGSTCLLMLLLVLVRVIDACYAKLWPFSIAHCDLAFVYVYVCVLTIFAVLLFACKGLGLRTERRG